MEKSGNLTFNSAEKQIQVQTYPFSHLPSLFFKHYLHMHFIRFFYFYSFYLFFIFLASCCCSGQENMGMFGKSVTKMLRSNLIHEQLYTTDWRWPICSWGTSLPCCMCLVTAGLQCNRRDLWIEKLIFRVSGCSVFGAKLTLPTWLLGTFYNEGAGLSRCPFFVPSKLYDLS